MQGVIDCRIDEMPIAVVDFETTGLNAGRDRVVEVSVVRCDPGCNPELVFDTLINPLRPVSATEIHGITDDDVRDAPVFADVTPDMMRAISGCVVAAYNVYFDIKFLQFELSQSGIVDVPPHFCLMYMRPMLGLGSRCRLEEACRAHSVDYEQNHVAANDALASGQLLKLYLDVLRQRSIRTFGQLADLKAYKFTKSFRNPVLRGPSDKARTSTHSLCSRKGLDNRDDDPTKKALRRYWDALIAAVADLSISDDELIHLNEERQQLWLDDDQVRYLHARVFECAIARFSEDQRLDDREALKLRRLRTALSSLGWAPGD